MRLAATTARARAQLIERAPPRIRGSYRLRRLSRRALHDVRPAEVPERPIGAKLEITYHCNLRCGFCYTDSPRRTLARSVEMDDEQWRRIVSQAIELGLIEAVVTGGEPLLRRELTLETVERLTAAGMMVTLNTNGWFLDAEAADRLAGAGVRVHVSLDGASAELHDASRGVPGSWRRAVQAIDLMLARGGRVQVAHVVTPRNEATFDEFLEQMRVLAPTSVRVVPVGLLGAAAREGRWGVDFERVHATVGHFVVRPGRECSWAARCRAPSSHWTRLRGLSSSAPMAPSSPIRSIPSRSATPGGRTSTNAGGGCARRGATVASPTGALEPATASRPQHETWFPTATRRSPSQGCLPR